MPKAVTRTHSHANQANDTDDDMFATPDEMNGAAKGRLRSFIERIERVNEDIAALQGDRKEIFAEAKGEGFDVTIMRRVIALRKLGSAKRQEVEALIDLYLSAIGEA